MTSVKRQKKMWKTSTVFICTSWSLIRFQQVVKFYYLALVKTEKGDSPAEVIEICVLRQCEQG